MNKTLLLLTVFLSTSVLHAGESRRMKIIRRSLGVSACALAAYDAYQTRNALQMPGIHETNPLGFNNTTLALKASACVVPLVLGEIAARRGNEVMSDGSLLVSGGWAAGYLFVVAHNQSVINSAQASPKQPGQLAAAIH
jgi:hypothetical protein